ncbi:MAG: hypothetical protein EOO44_00095 [Flavobacterium sp.]|nr:MAG: hypothetical protein EOO44_00095 [Flavobacterium sp.]
MSSKIDISKIVSQHIKSVFANRSNQVSFWDLFTFVLLPIGLSVLLVYKSIKIDNDYANTIIAGLSIYIGLSLNFIGIIFELSTKEKFKRTNVLDVLKETISNIVVTAIIALAIILLILVRDISIISCYVYVTLYFLLFELLVTLLMVFKRVYTILIESIDQLH